MKVIIKKTGEVKQVSLGHALNFLLPKKLAVVATNKKLKELESKKRQAVKAKAQDKLKDRQLAERLDGKVIKLKVKAGKSGKIHGRVTKKDIASELKILKSQVILDQPIKKIGEELVSLKFGKITAKVKVKLEAES